ncbi:MAG: terminase small subunit [Phycisphaerae bacterium]|nr:terminase small subunit [Phycisphaerae bacterium]
MAKRSKKKTIKKAAKKESSTRQFTIKQQKFIDCYAGDIKEAADKAGLSYDYARRLVTKSHILEAIRNRQDTEVRPQDIADRQERQKFWTQMMRDTNEDAKDRLKASDLLGKSEADFTENLSHKFPEGCGVMLVVGQTNPNKWKKQSEQHHKYGSDSRKTS